jgi:Fur family transcriptional regulator, peroxide stress response regulator
MDRNVHTDAMTCDADKVREAFHAHQLRHTRQRELVYTTLMAVRSHPTAEELHTLVKAADGSVSLATVYNTLDALVECGLCRKLPSHVGGGASRFDADLSSHVHVLTRRGGVQDVPDELGERLLRSVSREAIREIESRLGVEVIGVSLQLITR